MSEKVENDTKKGDDDNENLSSESVEVLKQRLHDMKCLFEQRQNANPNSCIEDLFTRQQASSSHSGLIDGTFLSCALCGSLIVILSVATYAFYHLYFAVLKKFPSTHSEL